MDQCNAIRACGLIHGRSGTGTEDPIECNGHARESSRIVSGYEDVLGYRDNQGFSQVLINSAYAWGNKKAAATYDGLGSWQDYIVHFEMIAEINGWDENTKALELATCLRGKSRNKDQSFPELAQTLRVTRLAYPTAPIEVREQLARDCFIDSLNDADLEWAIFQDNEILVARALVDPSSGRIPLRIANLTSFERILYKSTCLAECHLCDNIFEMENTERTNRKVFKIKESKADEVPEHLVTLFENSISNLTEEQGLQMKGVLKRQADAFANSKNELGSTDLIKHKINTGDATPIKQNPWRLLLAKQEVADREVQRMLDIGVIEPSISPWSSPIVLVPKKNDPTSVRFCIDYRRLNNLTKKDCFPLPRIEDCLDALRGPLHKLTEKGREFKWTSDCQESFEKLKQFLISAPILSYPDMNKKFILDTDASGFGLGAVLSQVHENGERVVAYYRQVDNMGMQMDFRVVHVHNAPIVHDKRQKESNAEEDPSCYLRAVKTAKLDSKIREEIEIESTEQGANWMQIDGRIVSMPDQEAETVTRIFVGEFIARFGLPRQVHTDQGDSLSLIYFVHYVKHLKWTKQEQPHSTLKVTAWWKVE
ncbi:unnamed protein product [Mytilus edulis]|uniref:Reverse transcriptase/retrotransposon-derived protein RNase H-like domain-containing protein n=1 Tax=Mytilus edulis TaxID=6550 RepID=A0A8S3UFJ9_MYTED|nr:unnamed protein product [Mytilus edulis]